LQRSIYILSFCLSIIYCNTTWSQCAVSVDIANIQHIDCPNGGAVGSASIIQNNYVNYWWTNTTTGQMINSQGNTTLSNLDAGLYVIYATDPYNSSCPWDTYSSTFEIIEANPQFQFNPSQACPNLCNVSISASMDVAISGVNYSYQLDNNTVVSLPSTLQNQCGGMHTYEIFADGNSCGVENIGVSQFAQMNLQTTVVDQMCAQPGSATVNITGVGASALSTYCSSSPQYNSYSTIDLVNLNGDSYSINNNTPGVCGTYNDYTNLSADVTPGNSYSLDLNLGTCHQVEALIDIANVFIDWNIDGDFDDTGELVGQISPTQSPSVNLINFTVPNNAIPGQSRMRIVSQNSEYQPTNQAGACDYNVAYFGETEDYTIVISGSVATPVSYLWSDGQITQTAVNLVPGTYSVTITDANGCTANDTALVSGGGGIVTSSITPTLQIICQNEDSDSLLVIPSGASGPYEYEWWHFFPGMQQNQAVIISNQTNSFLIPPTSNIGIEYFFCIVTSIDGCINTSSIVQAEIVTDPIFTLQPQDSTVCIGANLTIHIEDTFFVNVATNTINPIYQWYENSICDTSISSSSVAATGPGNNTDTYTPQTAIAGTTYYYCTVVIPQIIGCNTNTSECAEIIINPIPTAILTTNPNPACIGDDIQLTANTSIPVNQYRFQYDNGGGWTNLTNPVYGLLNPVTYNNITTTTQFRVRVREYNGCTNSNWSPIITVPINLISTPLISHN